jgi:hypothetical protein
VDTTTDSIVADNIVAEYPQNFTEVSAGMIPYPFIVTFVPPLAGPVDGASDVIYGTAGTHDPLPSHSTLIPQDTPPVTFARTHEFRVQLMVWQFVCIIQEHSGVVEHSTQVLSTQCGVPCDSTAQICPHDPQLFTSVSMLVSHPGAIGSQSL